MSSDLIRRAEVENVLHNNLHALIDTDQLYQLYKDINRLPTYSIPSTDILDQARAIKDYCEGFPDCEGCRFDNGTFRCEFHSCPCDWDLPEGEKEPPVFIDSAPLKDCKNTAESYGEICVKCKQVWKGDEE